MVKHDYILFDLDGTISKSADGIKYSLENAIKQVPDLQVDSLFGQAGHVLAQTVAGTRRQRSVQCQAQHLDHCLMPTAHQYGADSEKRMSCKPAACIMLSIWPRVNLCSSGVPKR